MATLTQADLHDAVAARVPYKPEDLALVSGDLDEWALDALRWLLPLAPEGAVESILAVAADVAEPYTIPSTALKVVQVQHETGLDVLTFKPAAELAEAQAHVPATSHYAAGEMTGGTGGHYGKGSRIWSNVGGQVKCHRIADGDTLNIRYIEEPSWGGNTYVRNDLDEGEGTDYHSYRLRQGHTSGATSEPGEGVDWNLFWTEVADGDGYSLWQTAYAYTSAGLVIPAGWEGLVAAYCARETAKKMKDQDMATVLTAGLKDELSRFGGFADVPETVGG